MHGPYPMIALSEGPIMNIMRIDEVVKKIGLSRPTIYRYIAKGVFPKSIPLGYQCVGWLEREVNDWILARIELRDGVGAGAIGLPSWPAA